MQRSNRPVPPGIANGHQHAEAFCLMQYEDEQTRAIETIWNSRDGVTPFIVRSPDGQREMRHVNWGQDHYAPHFKPGPGQRVFVTMTRERAETHARTMVANFWDDAQFPMRERFESKEAAIVALADSYWDEGRAPAIAVVKADGTWEG